MAATTDGTWHLSYMAANTCLCEVLSATTVSSPRKFMLIPALRFLQPGGQ